jgi:hypothetical protein
MRTPSKRTVRVVAMAVLLVGAAILANALLAAGGVTDDPGAGTPTTGEGTTPTGTANTTPGADIGLEDDINRSNVTTAPIPEGAELTVVATQGFFVSDENADLVAFTRSGTVVYHNDSYRVYFDVDPVTGTTYTVEYLASAQLNGDDCTEFDTHWCTRNVVERVNLSTGDVERVWSEKTERVHSTRPHDADRLNDTHIVVAGITDDDVFVVDSGDGAVEWSWNASSIYSRDQGGQEGDWSHINDVEVTPDGRIMVSVRNMDEVVFVEPGEGVVESRTLGTDDDHSVLYEQHNPDYVPAERGGPAVVVGDSENNRVVEYHRTADGEWEKAWLWRDLRLQWPRDADRLPNDRTLVVDSHGDRVLEVGPEGEVVWSVEIGMPYDAERLGTGDESAGGHALPRGAADAGSGAASTVPWHTEVLLAIKDVVPSLWVNSLLYVAPEGIRVGELLVAFVALVDLLAWGGLEYRWSGFSLRARAVGAWRRVTGDGVGPADPPDRGD